MVRVARQTIFEKRIKHYARMNTSKFPSFSWHHFNWSLGKMSGYRAMWDAHLSLINISEHNIHLLHKNIQPVHSALYHAGSKTREIERVEIDKMTESKAIEPAETKSKTGIVFATKKDKKLLFVLPIKDFMP